MKKCIGCTNIANNSFPFTDQPYDYDGDSFKRMGYWIDTEGCGIVQDEKAYYLKIFYCPICGKKLESDVQDK